MTAANAYAWLDAVRVLDGASSSAAGWLLAAVALSAVLWERMRLRRQAALVAEAAHELRNPLCAARLAIGLAAAQPREVPEPRWQPPRLTCPEGPAPVCSAPVAMGLSTTAAAAVATAMHLPSPASGSPLTAIDLALARAALALDDLTAAVSLRRAGDSSELLDARNLVAEAHAAWAPTAAAHGVCLTVSPELTSAGSYLAGDGGDRTIMIRGDRRRLGQGYGNLIANALEHGRGEVELRLETRPGQAWLSVFDGGSGMPQTLSQIVRRGRTSRDARGHGLAVADRVARAGAGRLWAGFVDAKHCVRLEFPLARDFTPRASAAKPTAFRWNKEKSTRVRFGVPFSLAGGSDAQ